MMLPALEMKGISKSFPGVKALNEVSFSAATGEVVGLIGENGAGKSTLLKILNGVYKPDAGSIAIDGRNVEIRSARDAFNKGIAMVFQEQSVISSLTIAENIFLGREEEFLRFGLISKARMNEAAAQELEKVRLKIHPGTLAADLSFSDRQMVEIAKALSLDSRIKRDVTILLDEPTSVLEQKEVGMLFDIVRELKQRASIVFISHRLNEVLAICDRIYVMRDGRVVHETPAAGADVHTLHQQMVGRQLQHEYYREEKQAQPSPTIALKVDKLSKAGVFHDVSFDLHEGEVLGIAGVIGSGREALARCLAGYEKVDGGTLHMGSEAVRLATAHDAVGRGIGFVPSERKVEGLITPFTVAENMTLACLSKFTSGGIISGTRESAIAKDWIAKLGIKTPSTKTMVVSLSGGNQQKVVLAKWRIAGVKILILDHPTRGIDVGAKEDVYSLVREMTAQGLAVILLGDTLDEVIGLSSRILVMKDGAVNATFDAPVGGKPPQLEIIQYMM
ncbi:sugar ABC transporter ATP-binding protein [Mesorhizobium sp. M0814]|uniref:sugar ABC transporter ATP-binding protein n=1 Tax=Mesorhizobium sp. M0814 TaxID=2957004 RepID=UPI0033365164